MRSYLIALLLLGCSMAPAVAPANEEHASPLEGQYPKYVLARNFDGVIHLPTIRETKID